MQRAAHRPRADDLTISEGGLDRLRTCAVGAGAHGEQRGAAVLGLNPEDVPDRGDGVGVARPTEPLGAEAVAAGLGGGQGCVP
jgi:hypothetical protein